MSHFPERPFVWGPAAVAALTPVDIFRTLGDTGTGLLAPGCFTLHQPAAVPRLHGKLPPQQQCFFRSPNSRSAAVK